MQLVSKILKNEYRFLCVINIFSKYPRVIPLKDKKGIATTNVFPKILDESNRKPNKIWFHKGRLLKSWLKKMTQKLI